MNTSPLNKDVARLLGLSESGVSRIRSGNRNPSLSVMQSVERHFNWKVQDQSEALQRGEWSEDFEIVLQEYAETHEALPEEVTPSNV